MHIMFVLHSKRVFLNALAGLTQKLSLLAPLAYLHYLFVTDEAPHLWLMQFKIFGVRLEGH